MPFFLLAILIAGGASTARCEENYFATVVLIRGSVQAKIPGSAQPVTLANSSRLPVGATVSTADASFVRFVLRDNSTVNLGPKSKLELTQSPDKASLLNLMDGQIRTKVVKDVLQNGQTAEKDKLRVKTESAALGVRGTDFLVAYNSSNSITSLVTFEGRVAMAKLTDGARPEDVLRTTKVFVTEGKLSTVQTQASAPSEPVKVSPTQFEQLKTNESLVPAAQVPGATTSKNTLPPVPPFVNSADFVGAPTGLAQTTAAGTTTNAGAGVILDLKTAIAIAPPPGSIPDPITGAMIAPASIIHSDASGFPVLSEGLKIGTKGIEVSKEALSSLSPERAQALQLTAAVLNSGVVTGAKESSATAPAANVPVAWVLAATAAPAKGDTAAAATAAPISFSAIGVGSSMASVFQAAGLPPPPGMVQTAPPNTTSNDKFLPPPPPPCTQCVDDNIRSLNGSTHAHFQITVDN